MKMTKKTMMVVALVAGMVCAASAKTWTNFVGVGLDCPVSGSVKVSNFEGNNFDLKTTNYVGINEMYMGVHENGFAVRAFTDTTFCKMNNQIKGFDFINLGSSVGIGAGYAPVRMEKFTLGVFGMLGLDSTCGYSLTNGEKESDVEYEELYFAPTVGCNVTAVYTPTKCFSVWGGCSADCVLPGFYAQNKITKSAKENSDIKYAKTNMNWKVTPAVGVCWKF